MKRTALAVVAVASCGPVAEERAVCGDVEVVVAGSDYGSSLICGAPGCVEGPDTSGVDLGVDPALAESRGRVFFLARDLDTVFEVDARCGIPVAKASVNAAARGATTANPHDVAVAPDGTLFVTLYNAARIAIVKDGVLESTIDLSSYDADGNPQVDAIRIVDVDGAPKAFVTLERLDDTDKLRSKQPSQMLKIDVASRTVEGVFELAGRNPFNVMAERDGRLFLAEPGNFDDAAEPLAGIERFDTRTSETKLLVSEPVLGGSVSEVAIGERCGAAIVAGPQPNVNPTSLVTFDPETGAVIGVALGPTPGYDLQGLAWKGRTLYVGDRRRSGVQYPLHVFEHDDACALVPVQRTLTVPRQPVAVRPAGAP